MGQIRNAGHGTRGSILSLQQRHNVSPPGRQLDESFGSLYIEELVSGRVLGLEPEFLKLFDLDEDRRRRPAVREHRIRIRGTFFLIQDQLNWIPRFGVKKRELRRILVGSRDRIVPHFIFKILHLKLCPDDGLSKFYKLGFPAQVPSVDLESERLKPVLVLSRITVVGVKPEPERDADKLLEKELRVIGWVEIRVVWVC